MGTTTLHDSANAAQVDDGDLIAASTTDSPEDIQAGLDTILRGEEAPEGDEDDDPDTDPNAEAAEAVAAEDSTDGAAEGEEEEVPAEPVRDERSARQKELDRIAKAARKDAEQKHATTKAELDAANARIRDLESGRNADRFKPHTIQPHDVPASGDAALAKVLKQRQELGPKPDQGNYEDFDAFEKKRDEWLEQSGALKREEELIRTQAADRINAQSAANAEAARTLVEGHENRVAAFRKTNPTYDKDLEAVADVRVPEFMQQALMEAEDGPAIIHYLAKHPEEAKKLVALSPLSGVTAIGRISASLAAKSQARPTPLNAGVPPRISRAPRPQGTVLGAGKGATTAADLDDPNLSQAEYNRRRDEMDRQKAHRR